MDDREKLLLDIRAHGMVESLRRRPEDLLHRKEDELRLKINSLLSVNLVQQTKLAKWRSSLIKDLRRIFEFKRMEKDLAHEKERNSELTKRMDDDSARLSRLAAFRKKQLEFQEAYCLFSLIFSNCTVLFLVLGMHYWVHTRVVNECDATLKVQNASLEECRSTLDTYKMGVQVGHTQTPLSLLFEILSVSLWSLGSLAASTAYFLRI